MLFQNTLSFYFCNISINLRYNLNHLTETSNPDCKTLSRAHRAHICSKCRTPCPVRWNCFQLFFLSNKILLSNRAACTHLSTQNGRAMYRNVTHVANLIAPQDVFSFGVSGRILLLSFFRCCCFNRFRHLFSEIAKMYG